MSQSNFSICSAARARMGWIQRDHITRGTVRDEPAATQKQITPQLEEDEKHGPEKGPQCRSETETINCSSSIRLKIHRNLLKSHPGLWKMVHYKKESVKITLLLWILISGSYTANLALIAPLSNWMTNFHFLFGVVVLTSTSHSTVCFRMSQNSERRGQIHVERFWKFCHES